MDLLVKNISILGATGSIGQNTLDLISSERDKFNVVGLTGENNIELLAGSAIKFNADVVATANDSKFNDLKDMLSGHKIEVCAGINGLLEVASRQAEWVMSAIVGSAGLRPGLKALETGANLALANKESMVAAGPIMKKMAKAKGVKLIPVDSEHSAISQLIRGEERSSLSKIIITASGGAFRSLTKAELVDITPNQASKHPNWNMGQRITIDSASLFNKALEVIEAKELFDFDESEIEVLIHPQSLVHAIACFCDGGMKAHIGPPDMRHAIAYALHEEKRFNLTLAEVDLSEVGTLNFEKPDLLKYPALKLGFDVVRQGGLAGAAFNAAKEQALDSFLEYKLSFLGMADVVKATMEELSSKNKLSSEVELETVMDIDLQARSIARTLIDKF
ncbi:1-deoxy-D-xylulose-5-phosphate reductoisomerase [Paracoccaceae bacterium]|jgi:1-deoxy-D-xylulose-5-phosphate reductoisomerase|nr:1-deoxy-D-xylulose-5-phosphate reductoisomerase [Paracoccaceae bacterium]